MAARLTPEVDAQAASAALPADLTELVASPQQIRAERPLTSVGKALRLLAAFRGVTPPIGVSELARRAGLPKSTTFRFLADLEQVGFVERDGSDYRLGMSLFELGSRVMVCRPNGLRDIAMHHMSELHARTGQSAHLGVLEGVDVVYISKVSHGLQTLRHHHQPGSRTPATCSALGKAILAFSGKDVVREIVESGLPRRTKYSITEVQRLVAAITRIRQQGVAYENEEDRLGVCGFAAPIMLDGRAVAAVSLSVPAPVTNAPRLSGAVREAAAKVSHDYSTWASEIW